MAPPASTALAEYWKLQNYLAGRHQVQRLLRRLPLSGAAPTASTRRAPLPSHLHLNELPSNIKTDVVRLALARRAAAEAEKQALQPQMPAASPSSSSSAPSPPLDSPLLSVRSPELTARYLARGGSGGGLYPPAHRRPRQLGGGLEEAALVLPSVSGHRVSLDVAEGATAAAPLSLTHENTAPLVDYADTPAFYVLLVPTRLLGGADPARAVQRYLRFSPERGELLLLRRRRGEGNSEKVPEMAVVVGSHDDHQRRRGSRTQNELEDAIVFAQCYSFVPADAHRLARRLASSSDSAAGSAALTCLFLSPVPGRGIPQPLQPQHSGRWGRAGSSSHPPTLLVGAAAAAAAAAGPFASLRTAGAYFPAHFRNFIADVPCADPPSPGRAAAAGHAPPSPAAVSALDKRLAVVPRGDREGGHLWAGQFGQRAGSAGGGGGAEAGAVVTTRETRMEALEAFYGLSGAEGAAGGGGGDSCVSADASCRRPTLVPVCVAQALLEPAGRKSGADGCPLVPLAHDYFMLAQRRLLELLSLPRYCCTADGSLCESVESGGESPRGPFFWRRAEVERVASAATNTDGWLLRRRPGDTASSDGGGDGSAGPSLARRLRPPLPLLPDAALVWGGGGDALVWPHSGAFVRRVLLPALRAYAAARYTFHAPTRLWGPAEGRRREAESNPQLAQELIDINVHYETLEAWRRGMAAAAATAGGRHANSSNAENAESMNSGDGDASTASSTCSLKSLPPPPPSAVLFLRAAASAEPDGPPRFAAVPIRSFLQWCLRDGGGDSGQARLEEAGGTRRLAAAAATAGVGEGDARRCVAYFLWYGEDVNVSAGEGRTIAFTVKPSPPSSDITTPLEF